MATPAAAATVSAYAATVAAQRAAADPAASAWVSANAGAGKTHVLVARLVRLLLAGTAPERILCLTFTKAAAAEMASRVFARLARWVVMADTALAAELTELSGRTPTPEELGRARNLFAVAMETPGGLKVQTIHAFCERLLQRFPLEAGVPPEFVILDDHTAATLRREARDHVLMQAVAEPDGPLGRAHAQVVARATEESFDKLLADAMRRRELLAHIDREDMPDLVEAILRRALEVGSQTTRTGLGEDLAGVLKRATAQRAHRALVEGSKMDRDNAVLYAAFLGAPSPGAAVAVLREIFLTQDGDRRQRLVTAPVVARHPGLLEALAAAQSRFTELSAERDALAVVEASAALTRIAAAVQARYTGLKHGRAALDFDDLIARAASLVADRDATDWVLYKLDGGLDHILIDEAQDTNPAQWHLIEALAREFFSGAGTREEGVPRTVFAVGDEKQSIYGFQGAEPRLFAEKGRELAWQVEAAGGVWRPIPLTLSFRTVSPVLDAVDGIFADSARTPGVRPAEGAGAILHVSNRPGRAGLLEIWHPEVGEPATKGEAFAAAAAAAQVPPADRLADRIARTIRGWLDGGEMLASEGRPVRAGDILILVRRRAPFAPAMVAALERARVPVAGADRMPLADQLAVQDLIVLCRFLLLPEDDLSLATVLKSPLFGLDDDDLIAIAPRRRGTLWRSLLDAADGAARYRPAAEQLKRWRSRADILPPFELLTEVLDHDGARQRLLGRLGAEAADAIDELLALAIAYDEAAPPSLEGFVQSLVGAGHEIKRDMEHGRDEVRVLTVHGAKGLEAPIVFLPDTCSAPSLPKGLVDLDAAERPSGFPAPLVWQIAGAARVAGVAKAREAVKVRDTAESHRLLYVALTRARDRLYVAGFHGPKGRARDCWYDLIEAGVGPLEPGEDREGRAIRCLASPQTVPPDPPRATATGSVAAVELPDWAGRRAAPEPTRIVPLAPSQIAPLDQDDEGDPVERTRQPSVEGEAARAARQADGGNAQTAAAASRHGGAGRDHRFLRGTVTHALLQHLPGLDPAGWEAAADRFVATRAAALGPRVRRSIADETLAVLRHPEFAPIFGPGSRAEVSIVAELPPASGHGTTVRLLGQIDRLVRLPDRVLVVDYKTNRPPPAGLDAVPDTYVLQLAAYRLALGRIFPGLPVHAALLWTEVPRLMPVPTALLEAAVPRLTA